MADKRIPVSLLAALGLTGTTACGPCLDVAACLMVAPPADTGDTGETGESGESGETGETGETGESGETDAVLDRVLERRVLPADVAARIRARRGKE